MNTGDLVDAVLHRFDGVPRQRNLFTRLFQAANSIGWRDVTGAAPVSELCQINPAAAGLAADDWDGCHVFKATPAPMPSYG